MWRESIPTGVNRMQTPGTGDSAMIHCCPFNEMADGGGIFAGRSEKILASGRAAAPLHLSDGAASLAHERGVPSPYGFRMYLPVVTMNSPEQHREQCKKTSEDHISDHSVDSSVNWSANNGVLLNPG